MITSQPSCGPSKPLSDTGAALRHVPNTPTTARTMLARQIRARRRSRPTGPAGASTPTDTGRSYRCFTVHTARRLISSTRCSGSAQIRATLARPRWLADDGGRERSGGLSLAGAAGRTARGASCLGQRRVEADGARVATSLDRDGVGDGPARCADPAGRVLRYAGPRARSLRRCRPRETGTGEGRRLGREAAAGRPVRAPRSDPLRVRIQRRGGRGARRVRVLRHDEAVAGSGAEVGEIGARRHHARFEALLEETAAALRRARA